MSEKGVDSRKGQFTIFVVLGFVLLVSVFFIIYLVSVVSEANYQTQAKKAVQDYLDSSQIDYYVYTCMDSSVEKALQNFTLQGGVFYDDEDGPTLRLPANYIPYEISLNSNLENFDVFYGLQDLGMCPIVKQTLPAYPIEGTHLTELKNKYLQSDLCAYYRPYKESGVFGKLNIKRLCYVGSSNLIQGTSLQFSPCIDNAQFPKIDAAEKVLSDRIINDTIDCVRFDLLQEEENHIVTLINEPPSARLILSDETFSVVLEFPFEVKLEGREPVVVKKDFEYSSRVRFTALHNYVVNLLKKEATDPFFDIKNDYASVNGFLNFDVKIIDGPDLTSCPDCSYRFDSILKVSDSASKIGNEDLTILSAIKNRKPALDYMEFDSSLSAFDLVVREGETITFTPFGIDPENKPLTYEYIGWKETYDETWNTLDPNCQLSTVGLTNLYNCVTIVPITPNAWTSSVLFQDTSRSAEYTTTRDDRGPHELTIRITDSAGLIDYQKLAILVIDNPQININATTYPDIPEGIVSIEDPFTLSSQGTRPPQVLNFVIEYLNWYIDKPTNVGAGQTYIRILEELLSPSINTLNIKDTENIQNIHTVAPDTVDNYKVTLGVNLTSPSLPNQQLYYEETKALKFEECLPTRGLGANDYPYPYNSGDDFDTNHICCNSNYQITSGNTCYNSVWYGEWGTVFGKVSEETKSDKFSLYPEYVESIRPNVNIAPPPTGSKINDYYELNFLRECDGNRGNICAGMMDYTLVHKTACTYVLSQEAQCQGPAVNPTNTMPNANSCQSYGEGVTFENVFKGESSNICETDLRCSNANSATGYGSAGTSLCQATCDSNGACKNPTNCVCDQSCGASCYPGNLWEWTGNICKFSRGTCSNTCGFDFSESIACADGKSYCKNSDNYCYFQVKCTENGPENPRKEYCALGRFTDEGVDTCFYSSSPLPPQCTLGGCTGISSKTIDEAPNCPIGTNLNCNTYSGWTCVP